MNLLLLMVFTTVMCNYGGRVLANVQCNDIHSFIKHYSSLLKQLPELTYPVFSMCTNAIANTQYGSALQAYQNMTKNLNCQQYLGHNRLNIFEKLHGDLTDLWSTANCDACINNPNVTTDFFKLSEALDTCLVVNKTTPCVSCDEDYQRMQQFYGGINAPDTICFDIEDRMNQSRRAWSGVYNCCREKKRSTVAFFSIASIACAMPLVFYVVMHLLRIRSEARELFLFSSTSVDEEPYHSSSRNPGPSSQGTIRTGNLQAADGDDGNTSNEENNLTFITKQLRCPMTEVDASNIPIITHAPIANYDVLCDASDEEIVPL